MKRSGFGLLSTAAGTILLMLFFGSQALGAVAERQTRELKLGGSEIVETKHPIMRVAIADPTVADVVVLSPRQIYVFGKKVGYTSVVLWDERTKQKTLLDVLISLDLTGLKEKIFELYPEQKIEVHGTETGIVLSGTVSGPEVVEQVLRLAHSFLPVKGKGSSSSGSGAGKSGSGVTNLLKVGSIQQVMLEVKFAEVRRDSGKDLQAALAFNTGGNKKWVGAIGVGELGVTDQGALGGAPGSILVNFVDSAANIFANKGDDIAAALRFLETEGLARTLAEPRLIAMSGQEASFLAGGEFPVVTSGEGGTPNVEFKEFGVGLVFTPVVMSDGNISLRVQPSVSEVGTVSRTLETVLADFVTRKLETTVQLHDGQTLALAGLLQDSLRESVSKVPFLGDIPILGALFRSTGYQQEKTDLLIAVTPHLVKPIQQEDLRYPGEHFTPPNWFEFYLEGRLEGRRMAAAREPMVPGTEEDEPETTASAFIDGGLEGTFGHSGQILR